jgi:hypothetical protein
VLVAMKKEQNKKQTENMVEFPAGKDEVPFWIF